MTLLAEASFLKKKKLHPELVVLGHSSLVNATRKTPGALAELAGPTQEFREDESNARRMNVARGELVDGHLKIQNLGRIDEGLSRATETHRLESQAACFIDDWARDANEDEVCLWVSPQQEEADEERTYAETRFVIIEALGDNQFELRGLPGQQNLDDCWQGVLQLTQWMTDFDTPPPPSGIEESKENLLRRQPFILKTKGEKDWLNLLLQVGFVDGETCATIESGRDWLQMEEARARVKKVVKDKQQEIQAARTPWEQRRVALAIQAELGIRPKDRACSGADSPFTRLYGNGKEAWSEKEGKVLCPCGLPIPKNQKRCPCGLYNPKANWS